MSNAPVTFQWKTYVKFDLKGISNKPPPPLTNITSGKLQMKFLQTRNKVTSRKI